MTVFNYMNFQTNKPRRPLLRQNNVTGMGDTWMRYLYVHVYIIFYIFMYKCIIIWFLKKTNNIDRLHEFITNWILCYEVVWMRMSNGWMKWCYIEMETEHIIYVINSHSICMWEVVNIKVLRVLSVPGIYTLFYQNN